MHTMDARSSQLMKTAVNLLRTGALSNVGGGKTGNAWKRTSAMARGSTRAGMRAQQNLGPVQERDNWRRPSMRGARGSQVGGIRDLLARISRRLSSGLSMGSRSGRGSGGIADGLSGPPSLPHNSSASGSRLSMMSHGSIGNAAGSLRFGGNSNPQNNNSFRNSTLSIGSVAQGSVGRVSSIGGVEAVS